MHPVVGHKPAAGSHTISLRSEILRGVRNRRKKRGFRLKPIFTSNHSVGKRQVVLRIDLFRAIQRILQRDDRRRRRRSLRLHELHVWSLKKKNRDRENARHSISPQPQS